MKWYFGTSCDSENGNSFTDKQKHKQVTSAANWAHKSLVVRSILAFPCTYRTQIVNRLTAANDTLNCVREDGRERKCLGSEEEHLKNDFKISRQDDIWNPPSTVVGNIGMLCLCRLWMVQFRYGDLMKKLISCGTAGCQWYEETPGMAWKERPLGSSWGVVKEREGVAVGWRTT